MLQREQESGKAVEVVQNIEDNNLKRTRKCGEGLLWRVWRYHRGNQNPYIEEEQTTQCPKEKVQKDKQRSIKHTYKTKDRVPRAPLKTRVELRSSGRISSSCSTRNARRVNLVTNPDISHERGKDREIWNISVVICDTDIP